MRFTDLKLVANGHVLEVYEYEKEVCSGFEGQGGRRKNDEEKSERSEEIRKTSSAKARNEVRRQVLANFSERSKFVTLTFKENITDIQRANTYFKNFIKRLKYYLKAKRKWQADFKYLAVLEFQDRGAVHYHMMCNSPYVPQRDLLQLWRKGG
ncbi:rolling circle replication-associated protein, partial [Pseudalkalibacillus sp. JSM 102089]|uniref:rolling circle replication-associated protein n=1 Tax=Pseudalkalibacillus sp. JSM 102089 TaxID=3229856 RepID=UPI003CD0C78B